MLNRKISPIEEINGWKDSYEERIYSELKGTLFLKRKVFFLAK